MIPALTGVLAPHGLATSFESIATVTVGAGGSASVSFSSIPQTYQHLQVRIMYRNTSTDRGLNMYINGDTTSSNYYAHAILGLGSSASPGAYANNRFIGWGAMSSDTANAFGVFIVDLLDYTSTNKYHTTRVLEGWDANGSGYSVLFSTLYKNTNAITSLTFENEYVSSGCNLAQYSSFALYGVKA